MKTRNNYYRGYILVNSKSIRTAMGVQGYPAVPILFELTSKASVAGPSKKKNK